MSATSVKNALSILSSCVFLGGCAVQDTRPKGVISHLPAPTDDVVLEIAATVDDQAKNEILQTKTTFSVSIDDDPAKWARAKLFFEGFLPQAPTKGTRVVSKIIGKRWALSNPPTAPGLYSYDVWRDEIVDGYRYQVVCKARAGGSSQLAELNARNLARFIQDGRLEVSILAR